MTAGPPPAPASADPAYLIEARGLTRTFKATVALEALDLALAPGVLFGLVGPDGAGKTTTLRLLAGLLRPSAGSATVAGFDLATQPESIKPHVGYMAQEFSLYGELSVWENLTFFADIYGVPREEMGARARRLLEFAGLQALPQRRAAQLSGGMQKKLALACTLIHQPQILLLDEPTTGVDPVSRREFWRILTDLHAGGTTIVVSTPYMDEADRCGRVGLMFRGRLVANAAPAEIRARVEAEMVAVIPDDWRAARALLAAVPGVREVQVTGAVLHVLVDSADRRLPQLAAALATAGIGYTELRPAPLQMEEAFVSLIRRLEAEEA